MGVCSGVIANHLRSCGRERPARKRRGSRCFRPWRTEVSTSTGVAGAGPHPRPAGVRNQCLWRCKREAEKGEGLKQTRAGCQKLELLMPPATRRTRRRRHSLPHVVAATRQGADLASVACGPNCAPIRVSYALAVIVVRVVVASVVEVGGPKVTEKLVAARP